MQFSVLMKAKRYIYDSLVQSKSFKRIFLDRQVQYSLCNERRRVSKSYFNSIKDIHKGQRGFVVGNGPSLKACDLTKIRGEVSIASNLIHLIYDQTLWRPTYLTVVDPLVWEKMCQIDSLPHTTLLISAGLDPEKSDCLTYLMSSKGHAPSHVSNPLIFTGK